LDDVLLLFPTVLKNCRLLPGLRGIPAVVSGELRDTLFSTLYPLDRVMLECVIYFPCATSPFFRVQDSWYLAQWATQFLEEYRQIKAFLSSDMVPDFPLLRRYRASMEQRLLRFLPSADDLTNPH